MSIISHKIKGIRKIAGLTQQQFGQEIGITKTHVSKIEAGKANPSEHLLKLICERFDINEEWLKTGEGEMQRGAPSNLRQILEDGLSAQTTSPNIGYFIGMIKATERSVLGNSKNLKEISDDFSRLFTVVKITEIITDEDKNILLKILNSLKRSFLRCLLTLNNLEYSLSGEEKDLRETDRQIIDDYYKVKLETFAAQCLKADNPLSHIYISYDGFEAKVIFDSEAGIYKGNIFGFEHIAFNGEDIDEITEKFHNAVDKLKKECLAAGKEIR
ncbi:MAG: helix-turn-helix domain-containing protein [Desulfococcaceae bacterium]